MGPIELVLGRRPLGKSRIAKQIVSLAPPVARATALGENHP
jgi:hypothetical protein